MPIEFLTVIKLD